MLPTKRSSVWYTEVKYQKIYYTRRVRPPNGGRRNAATDHAIRKCAFSPNCWGTGGIEGWGGNGHLLEAYSTKPTCKPQSTMCSFWDLRRYAVAAVVAVAVAGRGKLKNVIYITRSLQPRCWQWVLNVVVWLRDLPNAATSKTHVRFSKACKGAHDLYTIFYSLYFILVQ